MEEGDKRVDVHAFTGAVEQVVEPVLDLGDAAGFVAALWGEREPDLPPIVLAGGSAHESRVDESVHYPAGARAGVAHEHVAEFPERERAVIRDDAQCF